MKEFSNSVSVGLYPVQTFRVFDSTLVVYNVTAAVLTVLATASMEK
jgi:hypothetical protein